MTKKHQRALLKAAIKDLKKTTWGYKHKPLGGHWKSAMTRLNAVLESLTPKPVPDLGPVWKGGKSILKQDLTHPTGGILRYPAFDDAFKTGTPIIAPEDLTVTKSSSSVPGLAFYATGRSGLKYWFGHLDRTHPAGTKFKKGEVVGKVAPNSVGGGPHVHVGINIEGLFGPGKVLEHKINYTHGAKLVGTQLRELLNA